MAANVTLTVNVEQAKAALNQVNSAITQIKLNGNQITIGGHKVAQEMSQVASATEQVANSTTKAGKTSEENIHKITRGFNSITGASTKALSQVKNFAKGMVSIWTGIVVAVELAATTFKYFFTNLTESIDKMTTRGQNAIKTAQKNLKAVEQRTKASNELIDKLEKLNSLQTINTDEQRLAQAVIAKLTKEYGDLGITLDQTTGKYKGLYEARMKIDQLDRKAQITALKRQMEAQRDVVNASLAKTFGRNVGLDQTVSGSDFVSFAEEMGMTLLAQNSDILAKKWNTKDLEKQIEVIDQLINGLSQSDKVLQNAPQAKEAMQTLKNYKQQLLELNSLNTQFVDAEQRLTDSFKAQRDAIEKTRQAVQALEQAYEDQQRANSLATLEPQDRANAIRGEVEQLNKKNQALEQAIQMGEEEGKNQRANADALKKSYDQLKEKALSLEEQNKKDEAAIQKIYNQSSDPTKTNYHYREERVKTVNSRLVPRQKQLDEVKKQLEQIQVQYQEANSSALNYQQAIVTLGEQRQKNLNAIQQKEQQILEINQQIEEAKRRADEAEQQRLQKQQEVIDGVTGNLEKQLEDYNKTDLQKQIDNQLSAAKNAKGEDLTQDEVDRITFLVTQLHKMKQLEQDRKKTAEQQNALEEIFKGYEQSNMLAQMKKNGLLKEAVLLEAKLNAQKKLGRELTDAEYQSLKNYVEQQMALQQTQNKKPTDYKTRDRGQRIITNQLAQKGGFASSVVVDRARDVSKQILAAELRQYEIQNQIKRTLDDYKVIQ